MNGKKDWRRLKGRHVVVVASGVEYRGLVVELGETSLLLRSPAGHREIDWERITRVTEVAGPRAGRNPLSVESGSGGGGQPPRGREI
jgi:hypothetical protein